MSRNKVQLGSALLLVMAIAPGCAVFSGKKSGPRETVDFVASVEKVYVDCEVSREKVRAAMSSLETITAEETPKDPVAAYAAFVKEIETAEEQAEALRESVDPMKQAAEPFFQKWADDLANFTSPGLRQRSELRLAAARQRYQALVMALDPTQANYAVFNKGLRDHATFLSRDLNPSALREIRDDVRQMGSLATELDSRFQACLSSARAYADSAALPGKAVEAAVVEEEESPPAAEPKPKPLSGPKSTVRRDVD
jgi:hypothetical protein